MQKNALKMHLSVLYDSGGQLYRVFHAFTGLEDLYQLQS
jgi:hypothetical protein